MTGAPCGQDLRVMGGGGTKAALWLGLDADDALPLPLPLAAGEDDLARADALCRSAIRFRRCIWVMQGNERGGGIDAQKRLIVHRGTWKLRGAGT